MGRYLGKQPATIQLLPRNHIAGLILSNDGGDVDHDIQITVGECVDANSNEIMQLNTAITKRIDFAWTVGDDNGGYGSATALAADTWYHVFLIKNNAGTVDAGFDADINATQLLIDSGYNFYRRIGSILTDGSLNIIGFLQFGDDFIWNSIVQDASGASPTTRTNLGLTVPTGLSTKAEITWQANVPASTSFFGIVGHPDLTDDVPSSSLFNVNADEGGGDAGDAGQMRLSIWTNTSGQIAERYTNTSTREIYTLGWYDPRGKDA